MGTVTPYETTAGKRYRVRYRKPDHSQTDKRGFRTKKEAELYLAGVEVSKARGEYIDAKASSVTVGVLAEQWLANLSMKPSSERVLHSAWKVHVEKAWAKIPIGAVQHSDVQAWVTQLSAAKSATTVLRAYGVLAGILDVAVLDRRLTSNVARGVNLPRKTHRPHRYLTHGQVQLLAESAGERGTLVLFLAYTGLRWGEATALKVENLDALRRRVNVEQNAVDVGGHIIVGTPKSHETRSVPYPDFLSIPLAALCEGKGRQSLLFGNGVDHLRAVAAHNGWYTEAKKRAAAADKTFPTISIHDLRHTAASLAISAGANVKAVQRMLGHSSAAMTLDTYADLFEDDLDAVGEALNHARNNVIVGKMWAPESGLRATK
jgi:integrase